MIPETLFSDPAIVGLSSSKISASTNSGENKQSGLGPGSALSKLLDSAMANAAKETTPEPEGSGDGRTDDTSSLKSNRSSFSEFVPVEKSDHSKIYSISVLLELRSSPEVLMFDASRLPEQSFWRAKQRGADGHSANERNANHANNGPSLKNSGGKRNRRNQLAAAAASTAASTSASVTSDSPNWERKPAGFLKNPDIDHMSTDRISQLLGEAAEEDSPDWELPGSSTDSKIEMGHTVADFELWKKRMRQEERRKNDTSEIPHDLEDSAPSNEVDSFFSFAKPKDTKADHSSLPFSKPAESKSSRFSSFFGASAPLPDNEKVSAVSSEPSPSAYRSLKNDHTTGNSRFFNVEAQAHTSTPGPSPEEDSNRQERISHGPPPGMSPNVQTSNLGPSRSAITVPPGFTAPQNFPPGFRMRPGEHPPHSAHPHPHPEHHMMMMAGGRGPVNNDSFFLSLLNKSEPPSSSEQGEISNMISQQRVNAGQEKPLDNISPFTNRINAGANLNETGFPRPNAQPANHHSYHPYQEQPLGLPQQHVNSKSHAGIKPVPGMPIPPGMYPPGMFPPGMQALPHHGTNPHLSQQNGPIGGQMRGDMPPPWMRLNTGAPRGVVPPGFAPPPPPGFSPGVPQHAPNNQQQLQKDGE